MLFIFMLLGLSIGSFLNVLIYRLPKDESIAYPRSHCIHCKSNIPWYYNIPIISFILLKGISHCCHKKISFRYPFVEIISSFLWIWSYYYLNGFTAIAFFLLISSCLLVIIFTDYNDFIIPLELNVLMLLCCLFFHIYNQSDITNYIFSMFLLSGYFLILMFAMNYLLKKDSMGYGDIILIGIIGLWLGLINGLIVIFLSSIFSIIYWTFLKFKNRIDNIVLPFGSAISLAAIFLKILIITLQIDTNFF
tara:strand:- start:131 stop:877 length:747 start_codon:yes stop_codon:yes gene_type:complete